MTVVSDVFSGKLLNNMGKQVNQVVGSEPLGSKEVLILWGSTMASLGASSILVILLYSYRSSPVAKFHIFIAKFLFGT